MHREALPRKRRGKRRELTSHHDRSLCREVKHRGALLLDLDISQRAVALDGELELYRPILSLLLLPVAPHQFNHGLQVFRTTEIRIIRIGGAGATTAGR